MADRTRMTKAPAPAVGATGLQISGGYVYEEWDRRLQRQNGPKAWREMADADPTVGALLAAFEGMVRQTGHRLEPADDSPEAKEVAEFVESCVDDMRGAWGDTVSELLTCLPFGFALFEIVYKRRVAGQSRHDDGRIGWAEWAPRAQETIVRWQVDDHGEVTGAYQHAPPDYREVLIPLDRCLHVRARTRKGNPEGISILRQAYEPWYYAKNIRRLEAIGIERDLAGLPLVRIPISDYQDATKQASWAALATNVRRDEQAGMVLPSTRDAGGNLQYDFALVSTGGSRQIATDPIIARYERNILRSILADFLTLGDAGVGSYAQSVNRTDLFLAVVTSYLDSISDQINVDAVGPLLRWNGIDAALTPTFAFNAVTRNDVVGFAEMLVKLASAGLIDPSDEELRRHVYGIVDLPMPAEEDGDRSATGNRGGTSRGLSQREEDADADGDPREPREMREPDPLFAGAFEAARTRLREVLGPDAAALLDAAVVD